MCVCVWDHLLSPEVTKSNVLQYFPAQSLCEQRCTILALSVLLVFYTDSTVSLCYDIPNVLACCPSACVPSISRKESIPITQFWLTQHMLFTSKIWFKTYAEYNCVLWCITMINLYVKSCCSHLFSFKNKHSVIFLWSRRILVTKVFCYFWGIGCPEDWHVWILRYSYDFLSVC